MGGYERDPAPFGLDGIPRGLRGAAPDLGLRALRGADGGLDPPRARDGGGRRSRSSSTAPRPSRPTASSSSGESEVPGFWVAAGFCAHGLAGAGGIGKVMAEWIVEGQPEWDLWHMDIRRFGRQYRSQSFTLRAHGRGLLDLLRHQVPGRGARGRPAAARLARVRAAHARRRQLRREVGLGARQLVRRRTLPPGDDDAAPARLGRRALVACDRGRVHRQRASAAVLIDQSSFAKLDVHGPGACEFLDRHVRERGRPSRSARSSTRSCSTRAAASRPTSRWCGSPRDRYLYVTGTAFGSHNLAWLRQHLPGRRVRVRRRHQLGAHLLLPVGSRARATSCSR